MSAFDDLMTELSEIASSRAINRLLDNKIFCFLMNHNELIDDVHLDIQTLLKIEYPNPKNPFYQQTIKNQWKKRCNGMECRADIDQEIVDIIELCYFFKHNDIDKSFINRINERFQKTKYSKGIQVKEEKNELLNFIIRVITNNYPKKEPAINYAIAIFALRYIKAIKPFTAYNDSMSYLMFKRIISSNNQDDHNKVLSFNIPIIRKIYKVDIFKQTMYEIHEEICKILSDIFANYLKKPAHMADNFLETMPINDKTKELESEISKFFSSIAPMAIFDKKFGKALDEWNQSKLKELIENLKIEDEIYKILNMSKSQFKSTKNKFPKSTKSFDNLFDISLKSSHLAIEESFKRTWMMNSILDELSEGSLNDSLYKSTKRLLCHYRDVFVQFLIPFSLGSLIYLDIVFAAQNKSKVAKADKANPKKNSSAKTDD